MRLSPLTIAAAFGVPPWLVVGSRPRLHRRIVWRLHRLLRRFGAALT